MIKYSNSTYIPRKGDLVWIDFPPSSGQEIQKRRPGLVISRHQFNRSTNFAVICPITSTLKDFPTRYTLPDEMNISGQIILSQLKSLDFSARRIEFIEKIPHANLVHIDQIIQYIF